MGGGNMSNKSYVKSYWRFQLHRATGLLRALMKNKMSAVGLIILILSGVIAVAAPLLTPYRDIQKVAGPDAQPEWVMGFPDGYYLSRNLQAVKDPSFSSPAAVQALGLTGSQPDLSSVALSYVPGIADPSTSAGGSLQLSHPGQGVTKAVISQTFYYPYHGPPSGFVGSLSLLPKGATTAHPIHARAFINQIGGLNFDLWDQNLTLSGNWTKPSSDLNTILNLRVGSTSFPAASVIFSAVQDYMYGVEITFDGAQQVNITNLQLSLTGTAWGLLGTDSGGNDLLTRDLLGTGASMLVGLTAAVLGIGVGLLIGLLAGLLGGIVDQLLMRITDLFLTIPFLPLAIILVVILTPSALTIIMIIAFFSWMGFARVIRSQVLTLRERPFIEAARAAGAGNGRILSRHLFPNLVGLTYVNLALSVPGAILTYAALSFLGLGDPTVESWGRILNDNFVVSATGDWWWVIPPGFAIAIVSLSFVLIGYSLDEMFNPKLRKRQ
jgi:ABC-type dipeptide/oligopeptide/nickel transport system permease subunit